MVCGSVAPRVPFHAVRLYDRRMSSGQGSKPHKTPWFAGYMPMHFKSMLAHRPRPMPPPR